MATEMMHITFCNSQWFLMEVGTISLNYSSQSSCQMLLFLETLLWVCFPRFLLIYIKETERWMWLHAGIFCFYKFWLSLVLRKVLCYRRQPLCLLLFIVPKTAPIFGRQTEAYLELSRTSTMELYCGNS